MNATQRLGTGRSSQFSDSESLVFLQQIKLSADQTDVTFPGLDGDSDERYLLLCNVKGAGVGTNNILLLPNGLTTDLVDTYWATSAGSGSGADGSAGLIGYVLASGECAISTEIWAKTGFSRKWISLCAGDQPNQIWCSAAWKDEITNITSLVIHSTVAAQLKAGSIFTLYKYSRTGGGGGGGSGSPLTTNGDIFGFSTQNARIPVGTPGQVLTADPTDPLGVSWQWQGTPVSPLTTKGDIFVHNAVAGTRLPVSATSGALLITNPDAATGLSYSVLSGGVDIIGRFMNDVSGKGSGFVVDRHFLTSPRSTGYELWDEGVTWWTMALDFSSEDFVVCDVQEGSRTAHDVFRMKPGSGALRLSYSAIDAIPNHAYHLEIDASEYDHVDRVRELFINISDVAINSKIPIYLKNRKTSHMILMENVSGDIWRVSAEHSGADAFFAIGTSLSDGSGGSPDLFQFHDDGGMVIGAATGGSKGAGTLNVHGDIFKDGTAYTNPDYAFEHWSTGGVVKFNGNPGASEYKGRMSLEELETYCRENLRLPGINDRPMGMFSRTDFLLEKVEEIFTHLFDLKKKIALEESKCESSPSRSR